MLLAQLESDPGRIPVIDRAGLIDDAMNLARSGRLDYSTPLNLVARYLVNEVAEYLPWKSALTALEYVDAMLRPTPAYPFFRSFAAGIVSPVFRSLSESNRPLNDDPLRLRLATDVARWACHWRLNDCLVASVSLFQRWMTANRFAPTSLVSTFSSK